MNELINIEIVNEKETVNARELWEFLESKQDFSTWIKARIKKYNFVQDIDFTCFHKKMETNPATIKEYHLTIDMAKELSMVEHNEKGMKARRWFINREKKLQSFENKSLSIFDVLKEQIQMLENQEQRIKLIEARQETSQMEFFTVAGYCSLTNRKIDISQAGKLGRKCTQLSKKLDYDVGKISDPRFGQVNTYHLDVLKEVIE